LHEKGFIHRDIKPDNLVTGRYENTNSLYLIDLGFAHPLYENNQHIPFADKQPLVGTLNYCSLNTHYGHQQSRRDDLESLFYMLIKFYEGALPWERI
jgi:casein kinase 1